MKLKIIVLFVFALLLNVTLHNSIAIADGNYIINHSDRNSRHFERFYEGKYVFDGKNHYLYNIQMHYFIDKIANEYQQELDRLYAIYNKELTELRDNNVLHAKYKGEIAKLRAKYKNKVVKIYAKHKREITTITVSYQHDTELLNIKHNETRDSIIRGRKIEVKNLKTEINDRKKEYLRVISKLNTKHKEKLLKANKSITYLLQKKNQIEYDNSIIMIQRAEKIAQLTKQHKQMIKQEVNLNDRLRKANWDIQKNRLIVIVILITAFSCVLFALFATIKSPPFSALYRLRCLKRELSKVNKANEKSAKDISDCVEKLSAAIYEKTSYMDSARNCGKTLSKELEQSKILREAAIGLNKLVTEKTEEINRLNNDLNSYYATQLSMKSELEERLRLNVSMEKRNKELERRFRDVNYIQINAEKQLRDCKENLRVAMVPKIYPGRVYVLYDSKTGLTKIGMTTYTAESRRDDYLPTAIILAVKDCTDYEQFEVYLHKMYSAYRHRIGGTREIFKLNWAQIEHLLKQVYNHHS